MRFFPYPADPAAGIPFSGREKQLSCDSGGTASEGLYRCGNLLMTEENGEELVIAEGISPMLDVEAAEADMELSVIAQNKK